MSDNYSIHDFSIITNKVKKLKTDLDLKKESDAFYYLILNIYLNLQPDEIHEAITDSSYLKDNTDDDSNHDRGIDAIYIDSSNEEVVVHIFNFKYTDKFEKARGFLQSAEIDKIISVLTSFFEKDNTLKSSVNDKLFDYFIQLYQYYKKGKSIKYNIYFVGDYYNGLEKNEEKRILEFIENKQGYLSFHYILLPDILNNLLNRNKIVVDAKLKLIDKNFFEIGKGNIKALIAQVDVRELLKCIIKESKYRLAVDYPNYDFLIDSEILGDAFEDNVRMYLKQSTIINRNIKQTALNEFENKNIFYYNNGITITCSNFSYPAAIKSPILNISNLQIVNGGQTVRALFDAYKENSRVFEDIEILCKFYETQDKDLSVKISEYTNSQNPVRSRDIRSIDIKQLKLEEDLKTFGYFYERKKNQYEDKRKESRIDAEKAGQIIISYFCENPSFAKNKKSVVFGAEYENVFSTERSAQDIIFGLKLFDKIEIRKKEIITKINQKNLKYEDYNFVNYASYYILYFFKKISTIKQISSITENVDELFNYYDNVLSALKLLIGTETQNLGVEYSDSYYFKSNKLKENYIKLEKDINEILVKDAQ